MALKRDKESLAK